jgi:glyoxylase-like metal-dependent hydrolase (beta-lactamase superfamily II)
MDRPTIIDTNMHGREGITAAFIVEGEQRALVETGPKSSLGSVLAGLDGAGIDTLDWIIVTHIHLDHAGAAGSLAQRFPEAKVAVHEVGAPHLVDPSKLWSSAARIYGDDMDELWGGIDPIPADRIHALGDGDKIDLGGRSLQAIETPGHARHHHAFLDDRTGIVFTGDALGVRLPDIGVMRPATPPPEFNLEDAKASIDRLASVGATSLWLTHFGPGDEGTGATDIRETADHAIEALDRWAGWVSEARTRGLELDDAAVFVQQQVEASLGDSVSPADIDRMQQTTSYWMNTWGYMRYMDKKEMAG